MRRFLCLLFSTALLGAQAPPDTSFFAVSYIDVMPASRAAAVTAFKQYREASRKDEGFVRIDLFEQIGRPARFTLVETWANQKAFDAHMSGPSMKGLRANLDSVRTSDYDQRPYKVLTVGTASSGSNDRVISVVAHVDIGGQGTNAPELLRRLAETSRKEAGNLRFDVLQHAMRANHFTVIEAWQSQKALDAHAAAGHTKQFRDALGPLSGSPLDERIYKVVE